MINEFDKRAGQLHYAGVNADAAKEEEYSDDHVRRMIVYTRQDVVLLVSYLSSANSQLATIRRLLWVITAIVAAFGYWFWKHNGG